ncbi:MAG TPA: tRNA threonylcarbamoyladenosine biosynthesis protein RimN [Gammaproteobacteria bacterium]|nr:tRNA threonylcarbamoyladenosine biosynthesis protein RimN [Gammaproteobacteria bacterium]
MNRWQLSQAARIIHSGGVIAYPTEAVFGLGCDPLNPEAVAHLLALKQRPMNKGLILIAADLAQLSPFIAPLSAEDEAQLATTWPGPHTWLVPVRADTPRWLRGRHETIAVRVTAHPIAAALCRAAGQALVSTSANPAGSPPAITPMQVRRYFPDTLDALLHGPLGAETGPTPIRDLTTKKLIRPASS